MAGGWRTGEAIVSTADHHFPLPAGSTALWDRRGGTEGRAAELIEAALSAAPAPGVDDVRRLLRAESGGDAAAEAQPGRSPA